MSARSEVTSGRLLVKVVGGMVASKLTLCFDFM